MLWTPPALEQALLAGRLPGNDIVRRWAASTLLAAELEHHFAWRPPEP